MKVLDLLFPDREHLCPRVAALLEGAGYDIPDYALGKRIYNPEINVKYFRVTVRRPLQIANELVRNERAADISGLDCIREFPGSIPLLDLEEPVTKFVLVVPNTPDFDNVQDLQSFIHYVCRAGSRYGPNIPGSSGNI